MFHLFATSITVVFSLLVTIERAVVKMPLKWKPFVRNTRDLSEPMPCSSALTVLKWFDYWSLLFGLSIFAHERGKFFLWFNRFRGVMMIFSAVNSIPLIWRMFIMVKAYLFATNIAVYYFGQVVYCIFILVYGKKISVQLNTWVVRMTPNQRMVLQRTSCLLTLLLVVQFVEVTAVMLHHTRDVDVWVDNLNRFLTAVQCDYNFHGCSLFCILLIASYYSCVKSLDVMDQSVISLDVLTYQTSLIKKFMSTVNTFAGLPFIILLSTMFISLPGSFSFFEITIYDDLVWRMNEVVLVILQFLTIISLVTLTTNLKRRLEGKRNIILSKIQSQWHSSMTIDWRICLDNFSEKSLFEFSIMSLAPLDVNLILSLVSSIITFSILLVQYEHSLKHTKS